MLALVLTGAAVVAAAMERKSMYAMLAAEVASRQWAGSACAAAA